MVHSNTRRTIYVQRNTPAYSITHLCARAFNLTNPACNASPVICGLTASTTFSDTARFSAKKLWNIKCVFWFSLQLLFEKLLILRAILRDIVINVETSSCKGPIIGRILMKLRVLSTDFLKKRNSNIKLHRNPTGGKKSCTMRTDEEADMTNLIVAFRNSLQPCRKIRCILQSANLKHFWHQTVG
jgi:hypothetical protein